MKWFKHDTDASTDAKIKKLIMRYGAEGYAVYFHCLELIAGNISENNITFELEHDAEIIADNLKIKGTAERSSIDIVNDIMLCILELNLLTQSDGRIFCFKLLKRLDSSMTSSTKFRGFITVAKESHDKVMISHDSVMQDKKRIEEIRRDKNKPTEIKHKYGEYKHVLLTDNEYEKLSKEFKNNTLDWITKMDEGIEMKGYKYKSHYLALLTWYRKEKEANKPEKSAYINLD